MWFIAFWTAIVIVAMGRVIENIRAEGFTLHSLLLIVGLVIEIIFILNFDKWWNSVCEAFGDYYE